jgi:hypothetical protein
MDTWETVFKGMYKAASLLAGVTASKVAGTPGLFSLAMGWASVDTLPAAAGVMTGVSMPSLTLGMHSVHAVILFNALRASKKYSDKREQLRSIQAAMDGFVTAISGAIKASKPVPATLPEADATIFLNAKGYVAYLKQVEDTIAQVRAFVDSLDLVLDDISRCLQEWNTFLKILKSFMATDKPRNVFETLEYYSIHRERDWAWYRDETGFSSACSDLLVHRNDWSQLIDVGLRGALPRLDFDAE